MFVEVKVNLKGSTTTDFINPSNFLFAQEHPNNKDYQPCIKLYPRRVVLDPSISPDDERAKQLPKKLNMTLEELGRIAGFVYVTVKSLKDGSTHPIVISQSALISTRKYVRNDNAEQLYVIYVVGFDTATVTLYSNDDIATLQNGSESPLIT